MQGTVDGAMLNPVYVYEVKSPVNYFTIIPFDYTAVDPILLSKSYYETLPADLQAVIDEVGAELFDWSADYIEPLIDYSYEMIQEDMGCELFTLSDADMERAAAMAEAVWNAYTEQIEGGSVLLDIAKKITFGQ
jgi:TRAP-type C4-dicarboxylate transport system substrate-binding protein